MLKEIVVHLKNYLNPAYASLELMISLTQN